MPTTPDRPHLSTLEKLGYGLGDTASNFIFHTCNVFLFYYYTDVFGLAAGAVGTLFLVTRLVDALVDPLVGALADRTQTRWGKYRPYLLWCAIPFGVLAYILFANPALTPSGKLTFAYVTYMLMTLGYTAINIPYSALMGVITPSSQERTVLSSWRFACAFTGQLLIGFSARPLVATLGHGNEAEGFRATMAIFAAVAVGLFFFCFATVRERVHPPAGQRGNLRRELGQLARNRPWVVLFFAGIFTLANVAVKGAVTVHYFKYFVQDRGQPVLFFLDRTTIFMTSGTIALIAGVCCTKWFAARWGKRELMITLKLLNAASTIALFFIPPDQFWLMVAVNVVGTFIAGPTPALVWAMYADTADYGQWKFGHRSTGLIFSAAQFAQKMGLTIGGFLAGWLLSWMGFVANQQQSDTSLLGVRILFTAVPAGIATLSALTILFYPLKESEVARMEKELAEHRATEATA